MSAFVWFVSVLGLSLSDNAKKNLYSLNEPDYVFYDYFNKTLWETVDELGRERVEVWVSPSSFRTGIVRWDVSGRRR